MKTIQTLFLATVPLLSLLPAQDGPLPNSKPTPPRAASPGHTVTLRFTGGTLEQFVGAVRDTIAKANIVVAPEASGARLPAIELRDAGLDQALEAACAVASADFEVRVREHKGHGEPVYSIVTQPGSSRPVTKPKAQAPATATMVRSLARLIDPRFQPPGVPALSAETVLSAIQVPHEDDANPPQLRFHKDSNLLFVRGTQAQWLLVEQVIETMLEDRTGLEMMLPSAPSTPAEPTMEPPSQPAPNSRPVTGK